jgi:carbamoylphosphate synthase large subunit
MTLLLKQSKLKKSTSLSKKFTKFRPRVKSRHPSHDPLREKLPLLPFKSVVRLGSSTEVDDNRVECNTIEAVNNSANKLLMKECFTTNNVVTAEWFRFNVGEGIFIDSNTEIGVPKTNLPYPLVAKHIYGSRGTGNTLINNLEELENWLAGKTTRNYIFEKFYNYNREYRLHITKEGCFYTCRKLLKEGTPEDQRWYRNDSNSIWIVENNSSFDKPVNWDAIVNESINALLAVGLDIGAVDVKVQSRLNARDRVRENPKFIIIEINSAPSFGKITLEKYIQEIPKILIKKAQ